MSEGSKDKVWKGGEQVIKPKRQLLKVAKLLEKRGYHITEAYNEIGYLQLFVDGKPVKLRQMLRLWRSR